MKRCILLAGGPPDDCSRVELAREPGDFVIACDAGYRLAQRLGWKPDLVVGDFDSYCGRLDPDLKVYTAPARKDDTDTMLAVKLGLERGFLEFVLLGGFGGRLDHTYANLQTLCFLEAHGAHGQILSNNNRAWAVKDGTLRLARLAGWHLSVFAGAGICEGVTLRGLSYPLDNYRMIPEFPIGISNEFDADEAQITVQRGTLLVIASREAT